MTGTDNETDPGLEAMLQRNRESFAALIDQQMQVIGDQDTAVELEAPVNSAAQLPAVSDLEAARPRTSPTIIGPGRITKEANQPHEIAPVADTDLDDLETTFGQARAAMAACVEDQEVFVDSYICDPSGRLLAGSKDSADLAGLWAEDVASQQPLQAGDIWVCNDPYLSRGAVLHSGQWLLYCPCFLNNILIGFAVVVINLHEESKAPATALNLYGEGICLPPVRLCNGGETDRQVLAMILNNQAKSQLAQARLEAAMAAAECGAEHLLQLAQRFDLNLQASICDALRARWQRRFEKRLLAQIPEEPISFEDNIDDDGLGHGPCPIRLTLWREQDQLYLSTAGCAPPQRGPINLVMHEGRLKNLFAACLLRSDMDQNPFNDGFHTLIHLVNEPPSILQPPHPAPLSANAITRTRLWEALRGLLSQGRPHAAGAVGSKAGLQLYYYYDNNEPTGVTTFHARLAGGSGAGPDHDGRIGAEILPLDGSEADDTEQAAVLLHCRPRCDSGGAGRWRGGDGVEAAWRLNRPGQLSLWGERWQSRPWGLCGGQAGAAASVELQRGGEINSLSAQSIQSIAVEAGDILTLRSAGGGGHGDALQRPAASVQADVANGNVSIDAAADIYGVILEPSNSQVDIDATRRQRETLHAGRKPLAVYDFGEQEDE